MRIYESLEGLKNRYPGIVVALGNFDGIHLGHQKLIGEAVTNAHRSGGTAAVLTFYPHPLQVLRPERTPPMLLSREAKENMMAQLGVDLLLLLPFTMEFAKRSPADFIENVLWGQLSVKGIVVGYNYTFGHQGRGTPETLWQYGEKYDYFLNVIPPVKVGGQIVSSSLIRSKLAEGDVVFARKLLGYYPFTEGTVILGERRGNTLGFPTANVECPEGMVVPAKGVYRVKVEVDNEIYIGVTNVGTKPTFHSNSQRTNIEVHLLDFCGDLYGKKIRVNYTRRLRDEKKFNSVTDLIQQIRMDVQNARVD